MKLKVLAAAMAAALLMTACGANAPAPPVEAPPSASESAVEASSDDASEAVPDAEASAPEQLPEPESDVDEELPPENESAQTPLGPLHIGAPKGPTSMGMAQLMNDNSEGGLYRFTLTGSPDELIGGIIQGEYDFAAVPVNLAANLFQKTNGEIQIAAVNTLGVLYIVESGDTVHSVEDLRGRTIYATGQGSTPEFALNYILAQNGLTPGTDVTVEYKTEHTELASLLAAGKADLALLPQPFVTSAMEQNPALRAALDMTEEWDKVTGGESQLTMGCLVVRRKLAEENPEAVDTFLREYRNSINFIKDPENASAAAGMIEYMDILKADVAEKALPECNLVFLRGDKMKEAVEGFLQVLYDADPKSVGGSLPGDGFYYGAAE